MAPEPGTRRLRSARTIPAAAFAAAAAACLLAPLPAHALRIVNHNLLNYPSVNVSTTTGRHRAYDRHPRFTEKLTCRAAAVAGQLNWQ